MGAGSGPPGTSQVQQEAQQHPNLGVHIANRLVEIGCTTAFAVPGDFNLLLLDQLLKQPKLKMMWCCNELNAGYAADGFARKQGIGCCVVTFCVGGLSAINAVAGAYSEDLPLIVISGAPNSNDLGTNRILHHTTGLPEFGQQRRAFREVTCCQVNISHLDEAHKLVDLAISQALINRKPVFIEVACNLANQVHPSFTFNPPVPFMLRERHTNEIGLEVAVETANEALSKAVRPVLLAGPRIRSALARRAFLELARASGYAVAVLPDAKGMFPETYERFMGIYWGAASWPCVNEIVESSDVVVCVGAVWTDYATVGYSLLLKPQKMIQVEDDRVIVQGGKAFGCISAEDFLNGLAHKVKPNPMSWASFQRMYVPQHEPAPLGEKDPITTLVMVKHLQHFLDGNTALIAEVGDSWFNAMKLRLPEGCEFELQMRYGSIGWSVPVVLGYAAASSSAHALEAAGRAGGALEKHMALSAQAHGWKPASGAVGKPADEVAAAEKLAALKVDGGGAGGVPIPVQGAGGAAGKGASSDGGAGAAASHPRPTAHPSPAAAGASPWKNALLRAPAGPFGGNPFGGPKRVLGLIGDGSFQMTAQEISTIMRYNLNPIIILVNNGGYTIEVEIHDGEYNIIKNWDYVALAKAFQNGEGKLWATRTRTEPEFVAALKEARARADHFCFIEIIVDKDDCSKELLEWGSRVAVANSRPAATH